MPAEATLDTDAGLLAPGARVASRYIVEGVLGKGGMSVVLRARDERLGQAVALKVMRGSDAKRDVHVKRFLREARTVARLRSDHVVRVLDVDTGSDPPFLAMELLEGCDVARLLRARKRLPVDVAVRIVVQACRGVAEAHDVGVVHRDLKPSNLLLTRMPDGGQRVKVIDFGISKPLEADDTATSLTITGQLLGSPRYMSPEQVRRGWDVDLRTDIWSLGAILYELIAGVAPFEGDTVSDTLARIVADPPAPLREHAPEVPAQLAAIVAMCLEKDPALRPASARVLLEELVAVVPDGPLAIDVSGTERHRDPSGARSTNSGRDGAWSTPRPARSAPSGKRALRIVALGIAAIGAGALAWVGARGAGARHEVAATAEMPRTAIPAEVASREPPAPSATSDAFEISSGRLPLEPVVASAFAPPPPPKPAPARTAAPSRRAPPQYAPAMTRPAPSAPSDDDLQLGRRL